MEYLHECHSRHVSYWHDIHYCLELLMYMFLSKIFQLDHGIKKKYLSIVPIGKLPILHHMIERNTLEAIPKALDV